MIEESLRFDPLVLGLYRINDVFVMVGGVDILVDVKVLMLYVFVNRDLRAWDDFDMFWFDRDFG